MAGSCSLSFRTEEKDRSKTVEEPKKIHLIIITGMEEMMMEFVLIFNEPLSNSNRHLRL